MPTAPPRTPFRHPLQRILLVSAGSCCVGLAVLGVFLPVLPTTPFLLLAAACFARSSERLYAWLWNSKWFGPLLQEWHRSRTIPAQARITSMVLLVLVLGSTVVFALEHLALRIAVSLVGLGVLWFLWQLPRPEPEPEPEPEPDA